MQDMVGLDSLPLLSNIEPPLFLSQLVFAQLGNDGKVG
jgi:hypothetical protein